MKVPAVVQTTSAMIAHMATHGPDSQSHHAGRARRGRRRSAAACRCRPPNQAERRCGRSRAGRRTSCGPLTPTIASSALTTPALVKRNRNTIEIGDRARHRREVERGAEEALALEPAPVEHEREDQRQHGLQRHDEAARSRGCCGARHEVLTGSDRRLGEQRLCSSRAPTKSTPPPKRAALAVPVGEAHPERHEDRRRPGRRRARRCIGATNSPAGQRPRARGCLPAARGRPVVDSAGARRPTVAWPSSAVAGHLRLRARPRSGTATRRSQRLAEAFFCSRVRIVFGSPSAALQLGVEVGRARGSSPAR